MSGLDGGTILKRTNGQKPYLHMTINTGDFQIVDHTQPGWRVEEWTSQVEQVAKLLAKSGGLLKLAGGVIAFVSSNSGDDGQMAFTLMFDDGGTPRQIIGSYCDNPKIGHLWFGKFIEECVKMVNGPSAFAYLKGMDWPDQPWLAVAFSLEMTVFIGFNNDRYPLTWTQYEQLLVDAWQTMTTSQKRSMRRNADTNPHIRRAYDAGRKEG